MIKVYAIAADCGDGSMTVAYFDSEEACHFAEMVDPETYRPEGFYHEVYLPDEKLYNVQTLSDLKGEYDEHEIPLTKPQSCTLGLPHSIR